MRTPPALFIPAIAGLSVLSACDPSKRVPEGQYLLDRNTIEIRDDGVTKAMLEPIIKQKPNKRILGIRFYLHAYDLPDPEKLEARQHRKNDKRDMKNAERAARGKEPRPYKGNWWRDVVGEPPVILDSALTRRSTEQLQLYLRKEGWFHARVTDTVIYARERLFDGHGKPFKQRKARVHYRIDAGEPYHLRKITAHSDDWRLLHEATLDSANWLLKPGDRYSTETMDRERTRATDNFKELGHLFFTRDLVSFDADTSVGGRRVDVREVFQRRGPPGSQGLSGTPQATVWSIDSVTINMSRRSFATEATIPDTIRLNGYRFTYTGQRPEFRPQAFLGALFVAPNERFRQSKSDRTYRRLTNLRVFDRVDIAYDSVGTSGPGRVNCTIDLLPAKRQSLSGEVFGTNRGGLLGISAGVSYRHRNLFRSMASLTATVNLGLEAQRSITSGNEDASTAVGEDVLFNTVEVGPEVTVQLPKAWLINGWFRNSNDPRTNISGLFSYQRRPDYTRTLARGSFGWEFSETRTKSHALTLAELNVVKIPKIDPEFQDYLETSNDPVLIDSYTDHVILNIPKYTFTLNTAAEKRGRDVFFLRITSELAGTVLRGIQEAWSAIAEPVPVTTDTTGDSYYTLLGVRYAEYLKFDVDGRYYRTIHNRSSLVFRASGGYAKPYGNLTVMPFETSFFVGGSNGLRAWRARTVGPGSYSEPVQAYDRVGEIRLEGNIEYRFKLVGYLEGALFADAGNIWYGKEDPLRPGSGFELSDFYRELAIGSGVGARLNFDFFIIRFDLGLQMKDPSLPVGQRWIFNPKDPGYDTRFGQKLNFNLGIGYPF